MKKQQILHVQRAFLYNLYEHHRQKISFATLFGGRKHRDKFNFFAESELGCGSQNSLGKFTYICDFKRVYGNSREKVKKRAFILIAGPRRRRC